MGVEDVACSAGCLGDYVLRFELLDANDAGVGFSVRLEENLCFERLLDLFGLRFFASSVLLPIHGDNLLAVAAPKDRDQGHRGQSTAQQYHVDPSEEETADGHDVHEDDPFIV